MGIALMKRIERIEKTLETLSGFAKECICFPEDEPPSVNFPIELDIAGKVKCPLHGERFKRPYFISVPRWLRIKQWADMAEIHSEQYQKAMRASFPSNLWPAEEIETPQGRIVLKLKDGTMHLGEEPVSLKPRVGPIKPPFAGAPVSMDEVCEYFRRADGNAEAARSLAIADGWTVPEEAN